MPQPFELSELNIPTHSESHRLRERCPDITLLRFADGETIIQKGEIARDVFILLRGGCSIEQPGEGSAKQNANGLAVVVTEGVAIPAFVGEMAYLGDGLRTASARCTEETYAMCLKPEQFNILIEEFPLFTRVLCKQFATRLKDTNERLKEHQSLLALELNHVTLNPGDIVFSEGDPADTLYQLVEGRISREASSGSAPILSSHLYLGFLDAWAYFMDAPHEITVKATSEVTLRAISKRSKLAVIRNMPQLALNCLSPRDARN